METTTPLKLLLVGQYGVGKSSFFNRYFEKKFHPYVLSFSLDVKKKIVYYKGYNLILQMWDLVYSERMRGLLPDYYIKCKGILFVIDLNIKGIVRIFLTAKKPPAKTTTFLSTTPYF